MIVIDSSIWIDHIHAGEPLLDAHLLGEHALMHPHVLGEVALGSLRGRENILIRFGLLPVPNVAKEGYVLHLIDRHTLWSDPRQAPSRPSRAPRRRQRGLNRRSWRPISARMTEPPRLIALDALRGGAVMGILLMNITSFAMPAAAYLNPAAYGGTGPADIAVWLANFVLVDGKMRALFSALFGASMLLVIDRAEAANADGARVHFRRMGWLLGFGLVHAYLIWAGDILILYAITGMLAFAFAGRGTRALIAIGILFLALQILLLAPLLHDIASLRDDAASPDAAPAIVAAWREVADQVGVPGAAAIARELSIHRGGYAGILHDRLTGGRTTPLFQLIEVAPETLGLMLLGMAGLRSGFLTGAWQRRSYARIAAGAYLIALPPLLLIGLASIRSGFDAVAVLRAAELYAAPFRPVVMIGHAALLLWWLDGRAPARLAAVGRAAFSNYLGTSLAMTLLFYGYGAGLYGRLGRAELYLVVPVVWLAMLLWSKPWLERFRYGPLEWLWRSLVRQSWQPMRRAIAS